MKNPFAILIVYITVLLSACVGHHPQSAAEFRQSVPGSLTGKVETFEVERPFSEIAETFQKKAPKCLDVTVETTSQTNMSYQYIVTNYNPTVMVNKEAAELHLQQHHEKGVLNVTKEPEGGYYLLVVDARPVDNNTTRIDMYRPAIGFGVLIEAVKGWATGENLGCPDMTKL